MPRQEEATLLLKIKQTGKEVLSNVTSGFEKMKAAATKSALILSGVGIGIGKLAIDASKFDEVKKAFTSLVEKQGQDAVKMIKNMQTATKGAISEMDLMKAANNALLLGLPIERFDDMLSIARSAAKATGQSMEFQLNSIVVGIGRQSKLMIDNLGIIVDTQKAYDKYAATLNTTADKLTDVQKKQAFTNEVLRLGLDNTKKMGEFTESLNDKYERFKAKTQDLATSLGSELSPAVAGLMDGLNDLLTVSKKVIDEGFFDWISGEGAKALTRFESDWDTSLRAAVIRLKSFGGVWEAIKNGDYQGAIYALAKGRVEADKVLTEGREILKSDIIAINKEVEEAVLGKSDGPGPKKQSAESGEKKQSAKSGEEAGVEFASGFESGFGSILDFASVFSASGLKKSAKKAGAAAGDFFLDGFDIKSGIKGAAGLGVKAMGEALIPGLGGVFDQVFGLMTLGAEEFAATLDQMFSVEFLSNLLINIATLFTKIDELLINMTNALIDMLPELLPDMIAAIIKAILVGAPRIVLTLVEVFGSVNTWKEIGQGIRDGIVQGLRESVKTSLTSAMFDLNEKVNGMFEKWEGTDWDFFGGLDFLKFETDLQGSLNLLDWFSKITEEWDKIKGRFKLTIDVKLPGSGGSSGGYKPQLNKPSTWSPFSSGGIIPGYASGGILRDNQLIGAQSGEFMVNRNSAQENLPLLNAINQSNGPYQGGGGGNNISIVVNGGFLGDEVSAREFAVAVDYELLKLRQSNGSVAFDSGVV